MIMASMVVTVGACGALLLPAQQVHAADELKCGVLPSAICNKAKDPAAGGVKSSAIWDLLLLIVNIMTAGVAILAIGGIVYAAVLYTSAGPNQEQLKKAKNIILNTVIGIVAFALMYAFLQWIIPGGAF